MKVLVATTETQGLLGDYHHAVDGELVTFGHLECDDPDTCGCTRGFAGVASSRSTTTAMVINHRHISALTLRRAISDSLERDGWLAALDDLDADDLVEELFDLVAVVCRSFPTGTVVGRRGERVFARRFPDSRAA